MTPPTPSTPPSPPPQRQKRQRAGIPGTGIVSPNHTQDPKSGLSGCAHALAGHDSDESSARTIPGVAAGEGHDDPTQQVGGQAHPSDSPFMDTFNTPGAHTVSVEEQRRLGQQWKAQGRKACSTCGVRHPPPCNPGIVKKKKSSKVKTPWCRSCQEHHLFGKHTRTKQEAATLLTQQAYGMAPIPTPMITPREPDITAGHLSNAEIGMTLIHQAPQLLGYLSYQDKLKLRAKLYSENVPTGQHVLMQYVQDAIESQRGEEDDEDEATHSQTE